MAGVEALRAILDRIDGRGYKAYKEIRGRYRFEDFELCIDHVQGDPFAEPSRMSVMVPAGKACFPPETWSEKPRRIALEDYLTRMYAASIRENVRERRGTGNSGLIVVDEPRQEILERTSCTVSGSGVEIRFRAGLPAQGRRVLGLEAKEMLTEEIPRVVRDSILFGNLNADALERHLDANEDQDFLRRILAENGLTAFVADGSILPRLSGVDERPLGSGGALHVVPFKSPGSMRAVFELPHAGEVAGMAVPEGITLIVGGGFHGKSTLLRALESGVYNHIPGDGRELAVTRSDAVKIRSEDGRSISGVDIRPFIDGLPFGADTGAFTTDNASGSTSQAANIMEALEVGSRLLLIDEDTSATNFMIRDERMQSLVTKEREPITPFVDKVRLLSRDLGVSTILVMGGSGDYFDVADRVIMMDCYEPKDVTVEAGDIARNGACRRKSEGGEEFGTVTSRIPLRSSFDPSRGRRDVRIDAKGPRSILFGRLSIDLAAVEQLINISQTRAIGDIMHFYSLHHAGRGYSLREGLEKVMADIEQDGMDILSDFRRGDYALPRIYEVAAAVNRMRTLEVRRTGSDGGDA